MILALSVSLTERLLLSIVLVIVLLWAIEILGIFVLRFIVEWERLIAWYDARKERARASRNA